MQIAGLVTLVAGLVYDANRPSPPHDRPSTSSPSTTKKVRLSVRPMAGSTLGLAIAGTTW
jgi:hypothetical protein